MKVYLAGPMRGYENFNFPAFMAGAAFLRGHGHEVFNPAENDIEKGYVKIDGDNVVSCDIPNVMRDCILDDLTYIIKEADAIALLPGWEKSSGVQAELATAMFLGLTVWQISPKDAQDDGPEQVLGEGQAEAAQAVGA